MAGKRIINPGEIGSRIVELERRVQTLKQVEKQLVPRQFFYAKVTKNLENEELPGEYELDEQLYDPTAETKYIDKRGARKWRQVPVDKELQAARELNGDSNIAVDTIVIVYIINEQTTAANRWVIVATSINSSGGGVATDKSNTAVKGKIQFRNDITFSDKPEPPFDFAFQAPQQVGDVTEGNFAYGGNEDGEDGVQRHYKHIWNKRSPIDGYLIPGTSAEYDGAESLNNINDMWIRLDHRFNGQTCEIHHGIVNTGTFEATGGKFNVTPAGGTEGTVWAAATSGGATTIECNFDAKGHLRKLDGTYSTETDYPTDAFIEQTIGTYPTSSSLYNVSTITQQSNLVDDAGVDTDDFNNAAIGTIVYTAASASGTPIDIGTTVSTGFGAGTDANNNQGAGTGGNGDTIYFNLAKQLNGEDIILKSKLVAKNRTAPATMTNVESVQLVTTIGTTPVPDNSAFNVKVELEHGINGTAAQGNQFTRFDGDDEYQVVVYLFMDNDADAFDPDIAATYLDKQTATVDAQAGPYSGNTVSFTYDFPTELLGATVCARAYLEFFQTLQDPQPLDNQIGRCDISNPGDFDEDCQAVTGTSATSTLTFGETNYDPTSVGDNKVIDGVTYREVAPIVMIYKIQKGGDTTDFTGDTATFSLKTPEGVQVRVSTDGTTEIEDIILENPTDGDATDGFEVTIYYVENGLISNGSEYIGNVAVDGVDKANALNDKFSFNDIAVTPLSTYRIQDVYSSMSATKPVANVSSSYIQFGTFDDVGGTNYEAWGMFYIARTVLDGKKIRLRWSSPITPSLDRTIATLTIADGTVNAETDFPNSGGSEGDATHGSAFTATAALANLTTGGTGQPDLDETDTTAVIDLSSFTAQTSTIQVWFRDAWSDQMAFELYSLEVLNADGSVYKDYSVSSLTVGAATAEGFSTYGNFS